MRAWVQKAPADLSVTQQSVLESMVNSTERSRRSSSGLARRLPNSQLVTYPSFGHGGVFRFHSDFARSTLGFLAR